MNYFTIFPLLVALLHPGYFSYLTPYSLSSIRISPKTYTGGLSPVIGHAKFPVQWHVAQWGILDELPITPVWLGANHWQLSNAYGIVESKNDEGTLRLSLDSTNAQFGCGEFDLNIEPDVKFVYPAYPEPMLPFDDRPTLATATNLRYGALQEVSSAFQGTRCPGVENLASTMMALTFLNLTSHQVIFYQVVTYDSRGAEFNGFWFFSGPTEFGVNDSVDRLGGNALKVGEGPLFYDLDILPRIKIHIANGPTGLDKDLSHWKVSGLYLSANTNGEAKIDSNHGYIFLIGQ